ncbi:unnamed protein product, partial [Polarella glacialis]
VEAALLSLGFPTLRAVRKIKVSFHATYLLDFDGPVPSASSSSSERAVLQLIGSELGDKSLFHTARPISASSIARATALAQEAGVSVPNILATGLVEEFGGLEAIPFVIYEFIQTQTVEDEVIAPEGEWRRIYGALRQQLESRSLADVDTEPLPRFEDCFAFVAHLAQLAEEAKATELVEALSKMESKLRQDNIQAVPPTLIHQDLNDGNILCSPDPAGPSGAWRLDALIDWEGAAVGDPRLCFEAGEPWATLRQLAHVTKLRWLAAAAKDVGGAKVGALPRCCAEELLEDYQKLAKKLKSSGWLSHIEPLPRRL